jgi:hypothetical protein
VNFAKLLGLLRRSPPISKACKVAAANFTIQKERRSVDGFAGLGVSVKGSSLCIVDHAASSRPAFVCLADRRIYLENLGLIAAQPAHRDRAVVRPRWRFA